MVGEKCGAIATAPVRKIIPFSAVDGIGNRTAIFLQGCNIDCKYCHNPETRAMHDPSVVWQSAEETFAAVQRQMPFIRGVTVSGGECMLYPAFVQELFTLCKAAGLGTLIDSNGTIPFAAHPDLLAVTDGVMLDVKAFAEADSIAVTGAGNRVVLENARFLAQRGKLEELRTVVVPSLCDAADVIVGIAAYLRKASDFDFDVLQRQGDALQRNAKDISRGDVLQRNAKDIAHGDAARSHIDLGGLRYKLIAYRPHGVRAAYRNMQTPTAPQMQALAALATQQGFGTVVVT